MSSGTHGNSSKSKALSCNLIGSVGEGRRSIYSVGIGEPIPRLGRADGGERSRDRDLGMRTQEGQATWSFRWGSEVWQVVKERAEFPGIIPLIPVRVALV